MDGTVSMFRTATNKGEDEMVVQLQLGDGVHVQVAMGMVEFARALSGEANVPCEVRRFLIDGKDGRVA